MQNLNGQVASSAQLVEPVRLPKTSEVKPLSTACASGPQSSVDAVHEAVDGAAKANEDFVNRLVEGAHAIGRLADAAGPTADLMTRTLSNPSAKAADLLGQAGDKRNAWVPDVRDIVRERPLAAITVALAAGAIHAKLTATPSRASRDGLED